MRRERNASTLLVALGLPVLLLTASPRVLSAADPTVCSLVNSGISVQKDFDADGILEPAEAARVVPSWAGIGFLCSVSALKGIARPLSNNLVFLDNTTDFTSGHPYIVTIVAGLPPGHRDARFSEDVSGTSFSRLRPGPRKVSVSKEWTLHIGDSFTDTPRSSPFYAKIETLLHSGITNGCSPTEFCPTQVVSRAQIAIFVARALADGAPIPVSGTAPHASYSCTRGGTSLFADVAPTDVFCKHAHLLVAKGLAIGCGPSLFCPADTLTRLDMARFIADALVTPGGEFAVPVSYGPDSVTHLSYDCDSAHGKSQFTDVPASDSHCKDVNYLLAKGVVGGCGPSEYCPAGSITREQMAKFLVKAFALQLYGP